METNKYSTFFHIVDVIHKEKELSDFSKLVFYDIAYLCTFKGVPCYATNDFFAKKYDKSEGTVSKAIASLKNNGFIERHVDQNKNRKIYIKLSRFSKNNGSDNSTEGFPLENKGLHDINSPDEMNLVKDNIFQGYSPYNKDKSKSLLSAKIIKCVVDQFKIDDPVKTMLNLLPRLLEQNKYFNLDDIVKTLIKLINERNVKKIQEDISSFFEEYLGYGIVSFKRSEDGEINVDSLGSTYISSLAEYLILHLYDLSKEISGNLTKSRHLEERLFVFAIDTYEIIWHKFSEGEKATVKGRLTNINVIKGKDPNMPFANLKLMNPDNQELIIQVSSKMYQRSRQQIHTGKGEEVAISGPVIYSKRHDQNIIHLFEMEVKSTRIPEQDEVNEES